MNPNWALSPWTQWHSCPAASCRKSFLVHNSIIVSSWVRESSVGASSNIIVPCNQALMNCHILTTGIWSYFNETGVI